MKPYLQFDAEGLDVRSGSDPIKRIIWKAVLEVFAFKDDAWAYDIICFGFRLDKEGTYFKIDEEHSGYKEMVSSLPTIFPGIRDDWFSEVAYPAFEPCLTTLWGEQRIADIWNPKAEQVGASNAHPRHASCLSLRSGTSRATGSHR